MAEIKIFGKENLGRIKILSKEEKENLDIIIIADISGSMNTDSHRFPGSGFFGRGKKNRFTEMRDDVNEVAKMAAEFDEDGLTVIFFNSRAHTMDGVTPKTIEQTFAKISPDGGTMLVPALKAAMEKVRKTEKNVVILIYTDGVPGDMDASFHLLNSISQEYQRPKLGITFIQVGLEEQAAGFLDRVNNGLKYDIVAALSADEAVEAGVEKLIAISRSK